MLAASKGHTKAVQILIDHGAQLDKVSEDKCIALVIAASEGHVSCVRVLKQNGASLELKDKDNRTALMLAVKYSRSDVLSELLLDTNAMKDAMVLLQDGLHQREVRAAEETQKKYEVIITVDHVKLACSRMSESQPMFDRIHARLVDVEQQLKENKSQQKSAEKAVQEHSQNVSRIHAFLAKCSNRMIARIVSTRQVMQTCENMHEQLDVFVQKQDLEPHSVHEWRNHWDEDRRSHELYFKTSLERLKRNPLLLQNAFLDLEAQSETLTLLMFECENQHSKCTNEESDLIRRIFEYVESFTNLDIPMVPKWFVPPHEVEFAQNSFNRGSYGSVHHGTWLGAPVVVKSVLSDNAQSRKSFMTETEIWFKLDHPNVVRLFRACHVGNPFFVCEHASKGNLMDYLCRKQYDRVATWKKLHEAALGLQYLHKMKVIHNDLKCNNILVGSDDKTKIADFGLSIEFDSCRQDIEGGDVGAIGWKAPEVLQGWTAGTFESDVYAFGMCILEAVKKGDSLWGMMPNVIIKREVVKEAALPKRPEEMSDAQWELIQKMCEHDPKMRIQMNEVVATLETIANKEEDDADEAAWEEEQAKKSRVAAIA